MGTRGSRSTSGGRKETDTEPAPDSYSRSRRETSQPPKAGSSGTLLGRGRGRLHERPDLDVERSLLLEVLDVLGICADLATRWAAGPGRAELELPAEDRGPALGLSLVAAHRDRDWVDLAVRSQEVLAV